MDPLVMFWTKPMRYRFLITPIGLVGVTLLSACTTGGSYTSFFSEAGSSKAASEFGGTIEYNTAIMTDPAAHTIDLAERFAEEVPSKVHFAFNRSDLDTAAKSVLLKQADWIRQFPEVRFRVFGHTDQVGTDAYNQALGMRRARAVVAFLVANGVEEDRLEAVVSAGETQPIVDSNRREPQNRRAITEVSGFVSDRVLNGQYAAIIYRDYVASAEGPTTLTHGATGLSLTTE